MIDINSIPMIYDRTMQVVRCIDQVSDHDEMISKAIASCSSLFIYARASQTSDPFLLMDELTIDCVNNLSDLNEMLDDGTWTQSRNRCPHEAECGNSDCGTCIFAQLRTIDVANLRQSAQSSLTSGCSEDS